MRGNQSLIEGGTVVHVRFIGLSDSWNHSTYLITTKIVPFYHAIVILMGEVDRLLLKSIPIACTRAQKKVQVVRSPNRQSY